MTKTLGNILSTIAFAVLFALCLAFVSIRVLGLGTFIVTGGSMEPNVPKGSLVLVQPASPSEVAIGDIITFQQYDQTTTHRVVEIRQTAQGPSFVTKGDANLVADPEAKTFPGRVGIVRGSLPVAGYVAAAVQAYWRLVLTLLAAVIFFTCAGALIFTKERQEATAPVPARRIARRPVMVTVDVDETWSAHLVWLQRSQQRTPQVA